MSLRERINRLGEWSVMAVAWRLPRRLLYWASVRAIVAAAGDGNPADVKSVDILKHMDHGGRI
jgi:hypothetical protein